MGNERSGRGGLSPRLTQRCLRLLAAGYSPWYIHRQLGIAYKTAAKLLHASKQAQIIHDPIHAPAPGPQLPAPRPRCPTCGHLITTKRCRACRLKRSLQKC